MTSNDELRKLAECATQGIEHWDTEKPASEQWKSDHVANAAYMRKANPTKILSLLDQIEMLNKKLGVARDALDNIGRGGFGEASSPHDIKIAMKALKQLEEVVK